jgi:outer membrane protein assembly factor BamB
MYLTAWKAQVVRNTGFKYKPFEKATPAVSVRDNMVFAGGTDGRLEAFDAITGRELWYLETGVRIESRMLVSGDLLYFGASDGAMHAVDIYTGKEIWKYQTSGIIYARPAVDQGRLFFQNRINQLYALDAKTGKWLWHYQREASSGFTIESFGGPVVYKGGVFAGFSDGYAAALNSNDGSVIWTRKLGKKQQLNDIWGTPVPDGERVCYGIYSEGVICLDAASGAIVDNAALEGASTPVVTPGGMVVTTSGGEAVMIGRDMKILGRVKLTGGALSEPVELVNGYFAVTAQEGPVYILSWSDLRIVEKVSTGYGISSAPAVSPRSMYIFTNMGVLYKFSRP